MDLHVTKNLRSYKERVSYSVASTLEQTQTDMTTLSTEIGLDIFTKFQMTLPMTPSHPPQLPHPPKTEDTRKRKRSALGEGWDAEVDEDWDGWKPDEPEEADSDSDPMEIEDDEESVSSNDDEDKDPTYIPKWDR